MTAGPIRVVILGGGNWAATAHIPALRRHPQAEVVAIYRHDPAAARQMADDFGIEHAGSDIARLIEESRADAAIVSSIAAQHYEQAKAALQAGLHVLIEKPMTITAAEAAELEAIAARNGLHFLISHPWHYTRHAIEARRLVAEGQIGEIRMVSQLFTNFGLGLYFGRTWGQVFGETPNAQNLAEPYAVPNADAFRDPRLSGGGQKYNQIPHAVALLSFILGGEPLEVFARFNDAGLGVDLYDVLTIKWSGEAIVSIASCMLPANTDRQNELRIFGSEGMLLLEMWKGAMVMHRGRNEVRTFPDQTEDESYPLFAPAADLVDTILGRSSNGSPASLGVIAMRVIEAAIESARTGMNVRISR
jgi:predicted dehydrogenase